jgi:hypothetical protein
MLRNVKTFLARDFHTMSGMKYLIEAFYRSITDGTPVPIPYREILLTARIMDAIFDQLRTKLSEVHFEVEASDRMPLSTRRLQ